MPKANRDRQTWLILIPLGVVLLAWRMPTRLLSMPDGITETPGFFIQFHCSGSRAKSSLAVATLTNRWTSREFLPRGTLIDRMMNLAVRYAIQPHKEKGVPLVVWRDGKIPARRVQRSKKQTWSEANRDLAAEYPSP